MAAKINKPGLLKLPKDNRDFKLSAVIKLPKLEELPKEFELEPITTYDQLESDYCSGEATCGASGLQEKIALSPEWSFAVSKMISEDPEEYGQDLRTAMKVHTKYGAIEKKDAPYSLEKGDEDNKIRYINNWPKDLFEKAGGHKKQTFFKIDGQYTPFDDIRAFIWMFRAEKRAAVIGVEWSWPLEQVIMDEPGEGEGHALYAIGFKKINGKDYLVIQNSYGAEAGDNGKHYFSREVIDKFVGEYGSFAFIDMPVSEAIEKSWTCWQKFVWAIKQFFNTISEF